MIPLHELLSIAWACFQIAVGSSWIKHYEGIATQFSVHGDPQNPNQHGACVHRDLRDNELGVASRTLPCGSRVIVCLERTQRCTTARTVDRGPFGRRRNGTYRSQLDVLPAVAKRIGFNGYERLIWSEVQ